MSTLIIIGSLVIPTIMLLVLVVLASLASIKLVAMVVYKITRYRGCIEVVESTNGSSSRFEIKVYYRGDQIKYWMSDRNDNFSTQQSKLNEQLVDANIRLLTFTKDKGYEIKYLDKREKDGTQTIKRWYGGNLCYTEVGILNGGYASEKLASKNIKRIITKNY